MQPHNPLSASIHASTLRLHAQKLAGTPDCNHCCSGAVSAEAFTAPDLSFRCAPWQVAGVVSGAVGTHIRDGPVCEDLVKQHRRERLAAQPEPDMQSCGPIEQGRLLRVDAPQQLPGRLLLPVRHSQPFKCE